MLDYSDDVKGIIIGADDVWKWQVFYDGRAQMYARLPADSEDEAIEHGTKIVEQMKAECGSVAWLIYPHDTWEVRIWPPS